LISILSKKCTVKFLNCYQLESVFQSSSAAVTDAGRWAKEVGSLRLCQQTRHRRCHDCHRGCKRSRTFRNKESQIPDLQDVGNQRRRSWWGYGMVCTSVWNITKFIYNYWFIINSFMQKKWKTYLKLKIYGSENCTFSLIQLGNFYI